MTDPAVFCSHVSHFVSTSRHLKQSPQSHFTVHSPHSGPYLINTNLCHVDAVLNHSKYTADDYFQYWFIRWAFSGLIEELFGLQTVKN